MPSFWHCFKYVTGEYLDFSNLSLKKLMFSHSCLLKPSEHQLSMNKMQTRFSLGHLKIFIEEALVQYSYSIKPYWILLSNTFSVLGESRPELAAPETTSPQTLQLWHLRERVMFCTLDWHGDCWIIQVRGCERSWARRHRSGQSIIPWSCLVAVGPGCGPSTASPCKGGPREVIPSELLPRMPTPLLGFGMQLPGAGIMATIALSYSKYFEFELNVEFNVELTLS